MNEATKAEIVEAVTRWRPRLRLMDWSISYEWDAKLDDDAAMMCRTFQRYRRVTLRVSAETKNEDGWQTIEKQVLHELCHCLTAENIDLAQSAVNALKPGVIAYDLAEDVLEKANERLTEWIARIVWEAYEGRAWDAEYLTKS